MAKSIIHRIRILPLLVLVAFMSFAVRLTEVAVQIRTMDQALSVSAIAADEPAAPAEDEVAAEAGVAVPSGLPAGEAIPLPAEGWSDPAVQETEFSDTQSSVLRELSERRTELDARESRLEQREALLLATQKQIEEKIVELDTARIQIEELLGKQSEEEELRLLSLVKIYEGMKPKDAAVIFNTLEMDILLKVVSRMSERRSAPVIAVMDTERARELTVLLAEQKQLPTLPELPSS